LDGARGARLETRVLVAIYDHVADTRSSRRTLAPPILILVISALVSPAGTGLLKDPRAIPSSRSATAPAFLNNKGPNNTPYFKALLNGFFTRCLRFMPPLPTTMQDSLPAGRQPLPGGLDLPLGCDERFMFKRRTVLLS